MHHASLRRPCAAAQDAVRRLYNVHPEEELLVSFQSYAPVLPDAASAAPTAGELQASKDMSVWLKVSGMAAMSLRALTSWQLGESNGAP